MDLHQINLVGASLATISGHERELSAAVYRRLSEVDPTVRIMFPEDNEHLPCELVSELTGLLGLLGRVDLLIERSAALGRRHLAYGVTPSHYATMFDALLAALAEMLGDEFTDEAAVAWRRAFNLIAETMMMGARW
jgi:hemoglobin-like flavoprotein